LKETIPFTCTTAGVTPPNATLIGIGGVIVIVAETDFVGSVTEVAFSVTVPPAGIADGAVYIVGVSPIAAVALSVPHAPETVLPQLSDHVTWEFAESFKTAAMTVTDSWMAIELGGATRNKTEIGFGGSVTGGRLCSPPPHPANPTIAPIPMHTSIQWRQFISCLPIVHPRRFLPPRVCFLLQNLIYRLFSVAPDRE
jgi:hypothetical protein